MIQRSKKLVKIFTIFVTRDIFLVFLHAVSKMVYYTLIYFYGI